MTAPAPTLTSPAFDAALLARPLRRGWEVERFNQLSRRQAELTPAESDEIYLLRLRRLTPGERRLQLVSARGSEEELRGAIADHERRLTELRALEEQRREAGLSAGYEGDADVVRQARELEARLAALRPLGLVAGMGQPVEADGQRVRLPEERFTPEHHDAPLYLLAPPSLAADALAANVAEVASAGANLHLVHDSAELPSDQPALVLNWGGNQELPGDLVVLNRPEAVRISSDQVESLRRLGELAPRTVLNPENVGLLGSQRVVAKRRQGARGAGKRVLAADSSVEELASYDLYQEFLPSRNEWRVSVLSDRLVSAYRKQPAPDAGPENLRPQWRFERVRELLQAVAEIARRAAERIGLDYAGVDVVEDLDSGGVLCLETNTAPGMSADTLRSLYASVQRILRGAGE